MRFNWWPIMSNLSKTFFHPVLRESTRDFVDGSAFSVDLKARLNQNKNDENLCIDYKVDLASSGISAQLADGSAQVFLDLYSKETITRILSPLVDEEGTIEFKAGQLLGVLEVQAAVIATQTIKSYSPAGINKEYGDANFYILPGSILAISEKILLPLSFKRIKLESLIRVQLSTDLDPDVYELNLDSDFITILMGKSFHALWDIMRSDIAVKPYLALSIYKDTFVEALSLIYKTEEAEGFSWAQALIARCENIGIKLEELTNFSSQNQAALKLLRELGVHKLLASEV
ncbi:MAG: hypothetical protein D4R83_03215 [Streptomycetaceae bacterium]|nr:MAG: hypothetical protein D4R83_03215 [Streptomycetaceae bacterium]